MSIAKPFTFVANTYAKASEVNADFDTVYSQVNTNISAIAQNATDIDNLENNKADINGSSAQRFAVADAITNSDAINKQSLMKSIGNSLDYISGFTITKDSGNPNNTIIVSEGSCYDSTKAVVLNKTNSSTKTNDNQAANATYYVYVIGNATGSSVDILISTESVTPSLPSGYTLYRQIGNYTTDGNSNIKTIIYYGLDQTNPTQDYQVNYKMMPDYTAGTSIGTGSYTPATNGYWIGQVTDRSDSSLSLSVGGTTIFNSFYTQYDGSHPWCFPLAKGITYTIGGSGWTRSNFYPCIGEV